VSKDGRTRRSHAFGCRAAGQGDGGKDLRDQLGRWPVIEERGRAIGGDQRHAEIAKHSEPDFLYHEVAGEAGFSTLSPNSTRGGG
jgi:hypothetical protein